jgi:sensor histidine kinase regulating citrate/malate metabolism
VDVRVYAWGDMGQMSLKGMVTSNGRSDERCLCEGLVEVMGGRIWVQSEERCGSTFCFTVPLRLEDISVEGCRPARDRTAA